MNLIDELLFREEFVKAPPILLDIGASGGIHPRWKKIAKHSICISFDADEREMGYLSKDKNLFKKQYIYPSIVTEKKTTEQEFYLTRSPYCSSTLFPDKESINNYAFAELFEIEKKIKIKTTDLPSIFNELHISQIDWFKSDSQGTDLRLFKSIGDILMDKTIVAEFEPGIIDAYCGEDKLYELMAYLDKKNFWMSDMAIYGSQRIHKDVKMFLKTKLIESIKISPGWAEVIYFNSFKQEGLFEKRDFFLAWIFAIILKQYGFALEISEKGFQKYHDVVFTKMEKDTYEKIFWNRLLFKAKKIVKFFLR